ncbi:MAG: response regulator [Magnetococcales bacterium]|nr:response regulator [Magnetococcales bacterium]
MAKILIIDDDASIRALLVAVLENENHKIREADDGRKGLRMFQEDPADLVITDVLMPEKDGVELIMELKEIDPDAKIIAMSGGGRGLDATFNLRMAQDFGAQQLMVKPFSTTEALKAINTVLKS